MQDIHSCKVGPRIDKKGSAYIQAPQYRNDNVIKPLEAKPGPVNERSMCLPAWRSAESRHRRR